MYTGDTKQRIYSRIHKGQNLPTIFPRVDQSSFRSVDDVVVGELTPLHDHEGYEAALGTLFALLQHGTHGTGRRQLSAKYTVTASHSIDAWKLECKFGIQYSSIKF